MNFAGTYPGHPGGDGPTTSGVASATFPSMVSPAVSIDHRGPVTLVRAAAWAAPRLADESDVASVALIGTVARGRPPPPFIGAREIVAMHWVMLGAIIARTLLL